MPADALVDVLSTLSDSLSEGPLMSGDEVTMFESLLKNFPGLEVTPQIILNFIEEKTKTHLPPPGNSDDDTAAHDGHSPSSSIIELDDVFLSTTSPSRPHSRTQSQPQNSFSSSYFDHAYSSRDDNNYKIRRSKAQYDYDRSSISIPGASTSDSDDEDEIAAGLVLDRNNASSTSLELHDRLDALQKNNEELSRKLLEAGKTLQDKLANYDMELDEAQHKLEELRSELSASKREEKDLRTKDVRNKLSFSFSLRANE